MSDILLPSVMVLIVAVHTMPEFNTLGSFVLKLVLRCVSWPFWLCSNSLKLSMLTAMSTT
jgi:hypothetical protein